MLNQKKICNILFLIAKKYVKSVEAILRLIYFSNHKYIFYVIQNDPSKFSEIVYVIQVYSL